jgi:hypothetical protein
MVIGMTKTLYNSSKSKKIGLVYYAFTQLQIHEKLNIYHDM